MLEHQTGVFILFVRQQWRELGRWSLQETEEELGRFNPVIINLQYHQEQKETMEETHRRLGGNT
jgi:hypothetical protein